MKHIAVIGAGTMGNGIAHVFAQSGFEVTLIDVQATALERALKTIEKNLDRLIKKEKISQEDKAGNARAHSDIHEYFRGGISSGISGRSSH